MGSLLIKIFSREQSLASHQSWVFALFLVLTIILTGAAHFVRNDKGNREAPLVITAWFLWMLLFERVVITIRYEFLIYPEYEYLKPAWVIVRHLSLITLELPIYVALWILLRDNIKGYVRNWLRGWLDG